MHFSNWLSFLYTIFFSFHSFIPVRSIVWIEWKIAREDIEANEWTKNISKRNRTKTLNKRAKTVAKKCRYRCFCFGIYIFFVLSSLMYDLDAWTWLNLLREYNEQKEKTSEKTSKLHRKLKWMPRNDQTAYFMCVCHRFARLRCR